MQIFEWLLVSTIISPTNIKPQRVLKKTYPFPIYVSAVAGISLACISKWQIFCSVSRPVLGFNGLSFTVESLLFPCTDGHMCPLRGTHTLCPMGKRMIVSWFSATIGYMLYTEALYYWDRNCDLIVNGVIIGQISPGLKFSFSSVVPSYFSNICG